LRARATARSARTTAARLVGGGVHPVEVGVRRPTLPGKGGQAPLFCVRLNKRGFRRIQFRVRFFELQAKVGLVELRQRVAFAHESASVDKPGGYLAADPEGQIAFDTGLDDTSQNLRLLAGREMRVRDQDRAGLSGFGRLMRLVAAGREQRQANRQKRRMQLHGSGLGIGPGGLLFESARKANSTASSGRASGRIAGHCAIMVGFWMATQACSVRQPSSFGSPGPNSPVD
jgi:hypothetical protein